MLGPLTRSTGVLLLLVLGTSAPVLLVLDTSVLLLPALGTTVLLLLVLGTGVPVLPALTRRLLLLVLDTAVLPLLMPGTVGRAPPGGTGCPPSSMTLTVRAGPPVAGCPPFSVILTVQAPPIPDMTCPGPRAAMALSHVIAGLCASNQPMAPATACRLAPLSGVPGRPTRRARRVPPGRDPDGTGRRARQM
jgi:hypothetical protein